MHDRAALFVCSCGTGWLDVVPLYTQVAATGSDLVFAPPHACEQVRDAMPPRGRWIELPDQGFQPGDANWALLRAAIDKGQMVARFYPDDPMLHPVAVREIRDFAAEKLPFSIVPGPSQVLTAAAFAGIPLNGGSGSLTLLHLPDRRSNSSTTPPIETVAVRIPAETPLSEVRMALRARGVAADAPYAFVRSAGAAAQTVDEGTLETLQGDRFDAGVLFVGPTVRERRSLAWYERLPLFGKRVLVTRAPGQTVEMSRALRVLGAEPVAFPTIAIRPLDDPGPIDAAVERLAAEGFDWVVFTSVNGVDAFLARVKAAKRDARAFARVQIAAIGKATADRLWRSGLRADFVPERFIAEAVLDGLLARGAAGARVLIPRAAEARDVLPDGLRTAGARVDVVPVYRTVPALPSPETPRRIENGEIDIVTLTSSSTARNLVRILGGRVDLLNRAMIACIGPITAETAREQGLRVDLVAEQFSIDGLITALIDAVERSRGSV